MFTQQKELASFPGRSHHQYLITPFALLFLSLVPRPFPPPVFDRLQYTNMVAVYKYGFVYCKRSNTGGGNGLGTRLRKSNAKGVVNDTTEYAQKHGVHNYTIIYMYVEVGT